MPKGPNGEERPADVAGCAVTVMGIAIGEEEETGYKQPGKHDGGSVGGQARSRNLTPKQMQEIAQKGEAARWATKGSAEE